MPRAKKLTDDLKNELNALVPTSSDTLDNAEDILLQAEQEIARIDERAEVAISVITQAIRTRACVEKGRLLLQVQEKFENTPELNRRFSAWMEEKVGSVNGYRWINAAKVVEDNSLLFGSDEMVMNLSPHALSSIHQLPAGEKLELLEKVDAGEKVTGAMVKEVADKTTTKISKTAELLLAARQKKEAIASGELSYTTTSDTNRMEQKTEDMIVKLSKQLEDLELQLQAEQVKAKADEKKLKKMAEELDSLKFDDELAREQRVKRISNTLTIQLPNIQGDIQRYWAEYDQYPEEYHNAIDGLIKDLAALIKQK